MGIFFFIVIILISRELFLLWSLSKDRIRNINVHSVLPSLTCWSKDIFYLSHDAKPKKIYKKKQQMPPPWGLVAIQAFVVMAFLLSLCHAGLIAEGKVLDTKRFLLGRM